MMKFSNQSLNKLTTNKNKGTTSAKLVKIARAPRDHLNQSRRSVGFSLSSSVQCLSTGESHGSLDVAFSTWVGVPTKPWTLLLCLLINGSAVEGNQTEMTCRCFNGITVGTSFLEGVSTEPKNVNRQVPGTRSTVKPYNKKLFPSCQTLTNFLMGTRAVRNFSSAETLRIHFLILIVWTILPQAAAGISGPCLHQNPIVQR